jgi:formylglycine-generating enzyme required for sulfatase activity
MVGCGYSGGKPRHWVMIREVVSQDMLVTIGEFTACVGGGTKEVSEV